MKKLLFALSLLAACSDPAASTVKAEVTEAPVAEKAPAPATDAGIAVDASRSRIVFVGAKAVGEHPIAVKDYEGKVVLDGDNVTGVNFTAQMGTIEADHPDLTKHLKNGDFFDVGAHPTSSFQSTTITEGSEREGFTHTVTGTLTVKDIAKQISFPAKIEVSEGEVVATTDFAVDRNLWGITYPGMKDNLIQDSVRMEISFTAPRS